MTNSKEKYTSLKYEISKMTINNKTLFVLVFLFRLLIVVCGKYKFGLFDFFDFS